MRDIDELREYLENAKACGQRAQKALERALWKLDLGEKIYESAEAEDAFLHCVRMLLEMKMALRETYDTLPEWVEEFDETHALCLDAYYETPRILCCVLPAVPVTKKAAAARDYEALYSEKLQKKIIHSAPKGFRKFRQAYVIYAHLEVGIPGKKTPYYDNDNLAIKALLDAVVPLVCVDDSACVCDNFYLSAPSDQQKTVLWVIEKGALAEWAMLHPEMPFLRELGVKFEEKTR